MLAIDRLDTRSQDGTRGENEFGSSSSSPLRWVAGMVGWGGAIGKEEGSEARGERREAVACQVSASGCNIIGGIGRDTSTP